MVARGEADPDLVGQGLQHRWPEADCDLLARDPWELLVAVILSSRTADERVNQVMAVLAEHFVGPEAYMYLDPRELGHFIRRIPLHRQKARAIIESARHVVHDHHGRVPEDPELLARLPGVGPKTAAVVVGNAFGYPAVAADVHVTRIAHRLGWTRRADPAEAEVALRQRWPASTWVRRCHQLIRLGRDCCRPKRPWCSRCPVAETCPRVGVSESR